MKLVETIKAKDIKVAQPGFYTKNFIPLPIGSVTMLSSRGGYGKTFLAIRMALEIAKENRRSKILMWLTEDPLGIIKNRMKSIVKDFMQSDYDLINNIDIVTTTPLPLAYKERGVFKPNPKLSLLFDDLMNYDVIFFDPLLAFFGGDENDNSQARIFMQPFMDFAKLTDKVVVFLHHSTKEYKNIKSVTRGAGAFTDACRVVYELNYTDTTDQRMRKLSIIKDNWGAKLHFGLDKEILVIPENVTLEEDNEEIISDKIKISFSNHITEGFKVAKIDMDKIQDLVKSEFYYSATFFEGGYRNKENAKRGQNLIILDFDEGLSLEKAKEMFSVYDCVIATTKSHQVIKDGKKNDRFRVILRTNKPIDLNAEQYSKMMSEVIQTYGADKACKDASRVWAPYKDAQVYRYYGETFEWRKFWNMANLKELKKNILKTNSEHELNNKDKLRKAITTLFDNEFTEGNRNNTVVRALKWLKDEDVDYEEIKNIISEEIDKRGGLGDGEREKENLFKYHLR